LFEGPADNVATPNCGADCALCCGGGFAAENARWQHARQCRRRAGKWGSTHARQRSGCVNALTLRPHLRLRTCAVSCRDTGGGEAARQAIPVKYLVERNQTATNASPSLSPGPSTCPCSGAEGASRTRTRPSGCGPPPCVAARVHAACSPRACARRGLSELMAVLDVGPELTRLWCPLTPGGGRVGKASR